MTRFLKWCGAIGLLAVAYLLFWPVPIKPVAWQAPSSTGYTGPFTPNDRLAAARAIPIAPEVGPEHIEFGPDGKLYTAVLSGDVLRMNPDGTGIETVVNTGGRTLGLAFDADGKLILADAMKGLLAIDTDGRVRAIHAESGHPVEFGTLLFELDPIDTPPAV